MRDKYKIGSIHIGDIIKTKSGEVEILDFFRKDNGYKYVKYKCLTCGQIDSKNIYNILNTYKGHTGCRVCFNQKVVQGINDMWTTAPDIANLLYHKDDGYKYTKSSVKKLDWLCPICHSKIKNISIAQVSHGFLSCPFCSSGVSFPNRLMSNLLLSLNVSFIKEYSPTWAKPYRYDFFIPDMSLIIEMDGGRGHGNKGTEDEKKAQLKIDKEKDDLAHRHCIDLIRIDCNYPSNMRDEYLTNTILSSNLTKRFDLQQHDIQFAIEKSCSNYIHDASYLFNLGYSMKRIGKTLGVHPTTVSRYLKVGDRFGFCSYDPNVRYYKEPTRKRAIYATDICNKKIKFDSVKEASENLCIHRSSISRCLNGKWKQVKGYRFTYV